MATDDPADDPAGDAGAAYYEQVTAAVELIRDGCTGKDAAAQLQAMFKISLRKARSRVADARKANAQAIARRVPSTGVDVAARFYALHEQAAANGDIRGSTAALAQYRDTIASADIGTLPAGALAGMLADLVRDRADEFEPADLVRVADTIELARQRCVTAGAGGDRVAYKRAMLARVVDDLADTEVSPYNPQGARGD